MLVRTDLAAASDYFGRLSLGNFFSTERYVATTVDSSSSDYLTFSGRAYLRILDIGEGKWDFVIDLRDKYDQFDSLNKTKLQLEPKNYFQARQLYFGNFQVQTKNNYLIGRFSLPEAGGAYVDGLAYQHRTSPAYRIGAFAGLSPLNELTQSLELRSNTSTWGLISAYEPKDLTSSNNIIFSHSLVSQSFGSEVDRRYFYQYAFYQWSAASRILSNIYLDTLPSVYLQNWSLNWDQGLGNELSPPNIIHVHLLGVDTIRYRRIQNIRETLDSSPYNQTRLQWDLIPRARVTISPSFTYGKRNLDGLTKQELRLKTNLSGWLKPQYDFGFSFGSRKNFVSNDQFISITAGYFSDRFELSLDLDYSKEIAATETLTPITALLNASYVRNKNLFFSISGESSRDEKVQIAAFFAKVTSRFGSKETAPLRDGAPPRGAL
jgi:hypothetical protein